jgi:hypothetical protein
MAGTNFEAGVQVILASSRLCQLVFTCWQMAGVLPISNAERGGGGNAALSVYVQ